MGRAAANEIAQNLGSNGAGSMLGPSVQTAPSGAPAVLAEPGPSVPTNKGSNTTPRLQTEHALDSLESEVDPKVSMSALKILFTKAAH